MTISCGTKRRQHAHHGYSGLTTRFSFFSVMISDFPMRLFRKLRRARASDGVGEQTTAMIRVVHIRGLLEKNSVGP